MPSLLQEGNAARRHHYCSPARDPEQLISASRYWQLVSLSHTHIHTHTHTIACAHTPHTTHTGHGAPPLRPLHPPHAADNPPADALEAAARLVGNHDAITKFMLRGPGKRGPRPVRAPLSDPTAIPAEV